MRDKLILNIGNHYAIHEFMKYPIIKALLDHNIIYKSKYYNHMYIEHFLYKAVLRDYVKEKKSALSRYEAMRYRWF
jgi:hypothetical protein